MKKLLVFLSFIIFTATGAALAEDNLGTVNANDLKALKDSSEAFVLIDSRRSDQLQQGIIDGAVHLSVGDTTGEKLATVAADKSQKIVFYCGNVNCKASTIAGKKAIEAGYTNVHKYPGGFDEWKAKGLPTSQI